jgi:hypothetical protein
MAGLAGVFILAFRVAVRYVVGWSFAALHGVLRIAQGMMKENFFCVSSI